MKRSLSQNFKKINRAYKRTANFLIHENSKINQKLFQMIKYRMAPCEKISLNPTTSRRIFRIGNNKKIFFEKIGNVVIIHLVQKSN